MTGFISERRYLFLSLGGNWIMTRMMATRRYTSMKIIPSINGSTKSLYPDAKRSFIYFYWILYVFNIDKIKFLVLIPRGHTSWHLPQSIHDLNCSRALFS